MNEIKEIRLEDERALLTFLISHEGWKLITKKWLPLHNQCITALKGKDVSADERSWYAGLVTGYERLLKYPEKRIEEIDAQLKKAASEK